MRSCHFFYFFSKKPKILIKIYFKQVRGIWIEDETFLRVVDRAPHTSQCFKRKIQCKKLKISAI